MIRIIYIANIWILLTSFATAKNKQIDVYLIGGQSNATGQGYLVNMPGDFKTDTTVLFYYSKFLKGGGASETWQPLCHASSKPHKFGVELSLGTELKKLSGGKEIAIIKHALSGSNLYNQWNPGTSNKDTINFGEEYKKFVTTVNEGMEKLRKKGYKPRIRAMVWQQGAGDAHENAGLEYSRVYGKNLNHFIKRARQQFQCPKMLFIYGYSMPVPQKRFIGREEVRTAQEHIDQNSGHPLAVKRAFLIDTDDLPLRCDEPNTPYPDDKAHFNTYGILELGKRFAQKIHEKSK